MYHLYPTLPKVNLYEKYTFRRRELLPLEHQDFWQIEVGAVRTFTLIENGTPITLGTSRVTVTRLLSQMEQAGRLSWVKQYMLLCGVSELVG